MGRWLTGPEGGWGDLDLTAGLVGLEGWQVAGVELPRAEELWTLGACGAGAGAVSTMMRVLLLVHRHQLKTDKHVNHTELSIWYNIVEIPYEWPPSFKTMQPEMSMHTEDIYY